MTLAGSLFAEVPAPSPQPAPVEVITDLSQVWSFPPEMKSVAHPLRIEGRVSVYDPLWGNCWFGKNGLAIYTPLSATPPVLRAGQRVLIEGSLVPSKGLDAAAVTVKVLRDYDPIVPLDVKGRINELGQFANRIVSVEGYVDGQQLIDADHLRLMLVVDGRLVIGWLKPDDPASIPGWQGRFVRLIGLYSSRFDPTGTESTIELWISRQADLTVLGSLADDPGFNVAVTPINGIYAIPIGRQVHIRGKGQVNVAGSSIIVRDATGQIIVYSPQRQRIPDGEEVDAVGLVAINGVRWTLQSALYRRVAADVIAQPKAGSAAVLETADQICRLTSDEAARGLPVSISGTVAWVDPKATFFFIQDVSGGVLVRYSQGQMDGPRLLQYLAVEGVTYDGGSAPAVELKHSRALGSMSLPEARPISFGQAITGRRNGQWVEMRGFLERTESNGEHRRICVATATGEFVGLLDSPVNFVATPGSLIRVCGVCGTVTDGKGQITGVMLRVPFLQNITVDEDAPVDFYDLPLRPIKSLGELSLVRDLMRVRVSGVVIHAVPGRFVYLQDDQAGLLMLRSATESLAAGDTIEAVGILGREGARTVLREAVCHKLASGSSPAPLRVTDPSHFEAALDCRLVSVRGTLIDVLNEAQQARLTLQNGNTLFEAILDHPTGAPALANIAVGAILDVTGIYRADFDDARQLRGFHLQLRSCSDLAVLRGPRLWTVQRALTVATMLGIVALLGVLWVVVLRRQVRQQTEQIRAQMERQVRLEAEVQRAARLESLGVLAGGIAHDFNNLLTVVIGNLSLAMFNSKVVDSVGDLLREIEQAAYRARDLTQQLLTFAKGGNPVRTSVALPEIVRQAAGALLQGDGVQWVCEAEPGLWSANVDKDQITQVVQNLTQNAVEAMPDGGMIRISLANEEIGTGPHASIAAGRYVRVTITDSGHGIQPEILSRVFDPYFSTKEVGGGLGLATVYSIIKRHDGCIEAESTQGHGATFTFWLPADEVVEAVLAPPVAAVAPSALPMREARVLLMDDEERVRHLGAAVLKRMGLSPTTASDGAAAVKEFDAARCAGQPFDLVILDLTIPDGMGGRETIKQIRKIDANVPAIVSSGYSNDPVMADFTRYGFQAVVPKPYEVSLLMETVRRLLARRG